MSKSTIQQKLHNYIVNKRGEKEVLPSPTSKARTYQLTTADGSPLYLFIGKAGSIRQCSTPHYSKSISVGQATRRKFLLAAYRYHEETQPRRVTTSDIISADLF